MATSYFKVLSIRFKEESGIGYSTIIALVGLCVGLRYWNDDLRNRMHGWDDDIQTVSDKVIRLGTTSNSQDRYFLLGCRCTI